MTAADCPGVISNVKEWNTDLMFEDYRDHKEERVGVGAHTDCWIRELKNYLYNESVFLGISVFILFIYPWLLKPILLGQKYGIFPAKETGKMKNKTGVSVCRKDR